MALAGDGILGLWFDVAPEDTDEFYEWHNREHMPERLGNAGFRSGRRFIAVRAARQFFVLYETNSPETVSGPEYMHNVRFRSPWSEKLTLLNNNRAIFRVLLSLGSGQGGSILTLRYRVTKGREEEQRRLLAHSLLPRLADEPGIAGCHLARIDARAMHASVNQGIQLKVGPGQEIGPEWLILIEGSRDADGLERVSRSLVTDEVLASAGCDGPVQSGLYNLQYGLFRIAV
jgi:hypothetical protein